MAPASTLDEFQREFAAALLGEATSAAGQALAAQPGFAVYRNTVLRGCIDALAANYPTVATLVGAEWFDDAAGRFARAHLPRDGSLAAYGQGFADFLEAFEPAAGLAYLGGVARLDRAWTEAHLAADAPVLAAATLAALPPAQLLDAVLVPHPAARWVRSPDMPIFTIWRRHRERAPLDDALDWRGEGGLAHPARRGRCLAARWRRVRRPSSTNARKVGRSPSPPSVPARPGSAAGIDTWLPALVAAGAFTRLERRRAMSTSSIRQGWNAVAAGLERWLGLDLVLLVSRIGIAAVFFQSGRTKVEGWLTVTDNAVGLFRDEYRLPLLDPTLAAHAAAYAEHLFPLLLVLGLCTRFAALALLGMTLVIQIFVYPDAWPTHLSWAAPLLLLAARGGGRFALDRAMSLP